MNSGLAPPAAVRGAGKPKHCIYLPKHMTDPRYKKLASLLVNYSTEIKKGDRALLDLTDVPDEFSLELMRAVRAAGGTPFIEVRHTRIAREIVQALIAPGGRRQ